MRISPSSTTRFSLGLPRSRPRPSRPVTTRISPRPQIAKRRTFTASIRTAKEPQLRTGFIHPRGRVPAVRLSVAVPAHFDLNALIASHYGLPSSPRPQHLVHHPPAPPQPPPSASSPQSPSQRAPRPLPRIPGSAAPIPPPPPPPIMYGGMPEPRPYQQEDPRKKHNSIDMCVFLHTIFARAVSDLL